MDPFSSEIQASHPLNINPHFHLANLCADHDADQGAKNHQPSEGQIRNIQEVNNKVLLVQSRIVAINMHMAKNFPLEDIRIKAETAAVGCG